MVMPNYEQLVDKIAKASGLTVEDVTLKIEAKCAKLSGLISKEGSAQIVASELGVNLEKEKLKVAELVSGMRKVSIVGKIIKEPVISDFTTKNGNNGKVLSTTLADESGNVRLVLWDTNHIKLFEEGKLKHDQIVDISNGNVRGTELHLSGLSEIRPSNEKLENIKKENHVFEKTISQLKSGDNVKIRGFVVQIYPPRFFEVNKETGRKITDEEKQKGVESEKRAILAVVLDDGSENMKGVLFGDQISQLGFTEEDLSDNNKFLKKKETVLGEEMFFNCNVRNNQMFNTTEMIVNGIDKIELDSLVESLK